MITQILNQINDEQATLKVLRRVADKLPALDGFDVKYAFGLPGQVTIHVDTDNKKDWKRARRLLGDHVTYRWILTTQHGTFASQNWWLDTKYEGIDICLSFDARNECLVRVGERVVPVFEVHCPV